MSLQDETFLNKIWKPRPMIICGAFDRERALKTAEETGQLIAVGQYFLSTVSAQNPLFFG